MSKLMNIPDITLVAPTRDGFLIKLGNSYYFNPLEAEEVIKKLEQAVFKVKQLEAAKPKPHVHAKAIHLLCMLNMQLLVVILGLVGSLIFLVLICQLTG